VICETGGQACLNEWIQKNSKSFTTVDVTIDGSVYTFIIFSDGEVIDSEGEVICVSGGQECLDEYVLNLMPEEEINLVDVNINGINYQFIIDAATGEVFDDQYNLICSGGQECLDAHVESLTFIQYTANGVDYRIYRNGKVFSGDGLTTVCETGGEGCLIKILEQQAISAYSSFSFFGKNTVGSSISTSTYVSGIAIILLVACVAFLYKKKEEQKRRQVEDGYVMLASQNSSLKQSLL